MSIEDRVAALETAVGDFTVKAADDLARGRPAELKNGDYPIFYRLHQLGASFNDVVEKVGKMWEAFKAGATQAPDTTLATKLSALDSRLKVVEARPSTTVQVVPSTPAPVVNVPDDIRSQVIAILNSAGLEIKSDGNLREIHLRAGGITHTYSNTENDRGSRKTTNFEIGRGWRTGSTHTDPRLCQISEADEQDGAHSITYTKPDLVPNPTIEEELTPGEWDGVPGKSLYTRFADWSGRHLRRITHGAGKPGMEYAIGIVPKNGTPNVLEDRFVVRDSGAYVIFPDGSEHKVVVEP